MHDLSLPSKLNEIASHDLAILGMGTDGHFASIFPFMSNLDEAIDSTDPVIRVDSGYPEVPRITLSLSEILKSKKMVLLITGQEKVDLIKTKRDNSNSLPIDALNEGIKTYTIMWLEKAIELDLIQINDEEKKELYKHVKIKSGVPKFDKFTKELQSKLHKDFISLND